MHKKTKTTTIGGGAQYAKVSDRILEFRNANPRGLIETLPSFLPDGSLLFKARIVKDKADEFSAEAIGHSLTKDMKAVKNFEKQESIAVGRALALLGYSAGGEIASSDEMEEFEDYKETQRLEAIQDAVDKINTAKSLEELAEVWTSIGALKAEPEVMAVKETRKVELSKPKPAKKNASNQSRKE